jgi:pimeloyl-ACP methyl ester carboxylesterase
MTPRMIVLLVTVFLPLPPAQAAMTEEMIDLPTCTLHVRTFKGSTDANGPRFIMMDGVPLSGAIFKHLGEKLSVRMNASSTFIDFPGVAGSTLKGEKYQWAPLRTCLRSYLETQPPHVFVLADLAAPVVIPLLPALPNIQGLVAMNTVIKPSQVHPPFPLNILRCCPRMGVALGSITPRFIYEQRIRNLGLGRPQAVEAQELHALYAELRQNHGLRRLAGLMSAIELNEATDQLIRDGLATPISQLFLWGEADPVLGAEYKHLPPLSAHQQLILFPQARHFLMMDYAEEITEAVASWHAGLH